MALTQQIPAPADSAPLDSVPADTVARDSASVDSVASDSAAVDTVVHDTVYYILLDPPVAPKLPAAPGRPGGLTDGMSWLLLSLAILFVVVAIRFRRNSKYLAAMFRDAVKVRERDNVFDETVREKSFVFLLNVLWCISAGIILYRLLVFTSALPAITAAVQLPPGLRLVPPGGYTDAIAPAGMGICIGLTAVWQLLMVGAYEVVGRVFDDRTHTAMWVNGYLATTGLSTLIFFPLSLLSIFYPGYAGLILSVAACGFLTAKLIFIWKGFRIFFKEITSWFLFLYYLCSLETVPLILLYVASMILCGTVL